MQLGRNFSALCGSVAVADRVGSFAHVSIRCILCLDENRAKRARMILWLESGLQFDQVNPRSESLT